MARDDRKDAGGVSRRGLLGIFTRGLADAKDVAKTELDKTKRERAAEASRVPAPQGAAEPPQAGAQRPAAHPARPSYPRRERAASETLAVKVDAAGRVFVDLAVAPLAVGGSWRLAAAPLDDPIVLVRVSQDHHAACGGACPVDRSDLLWSGPQDVLWCPSCGSRWRLDGNVMRGPATARLRAWHTDVLEGQARLSR